MTHIPNKGDRILDSSTVEQIEAKATSWIEAGCSAFDVKRFPSENELDDFIEGICQLCPETIVDLKSRTERSIDPLPLKIILNDSDKDPNDKDSI